MNAASSGARSAANDSANRSRSRNRKPSTGGRIGGTGAPGGGSAIRALTDSPASGGERRDVHEPGDALVLAGLGDDPPAIGMAHQDRRPVLAIEHVTGRLNVALERKCLVLHDAHIQAVRRPPVVDAPPAGPVPQPA